METPNGQRGSFAERRNRRNLGRAQRGEDRGQHGDPNANGERDDNRLPRQDQPRGRQAEANRTKQLVESPGKDHPKPNADDRGDGTDDERLAHHGAEDLPTRGANRAQHREFARALGDRNRERVVDDERADQHSDARKGEQGVANDLADQVVEHAGLFVGVLLAGLDDDVRLRQRGAHVGLQLIVGNAVLGFGVDVARLALQRPPVLDVNQRRQHGRGAAERRRPVAVLHDAHDLDGLDAVLRGERDGLANLRLGFGGDFLGDRDLSGGCRQSPLDRRVRVEFFGHAGEHETRRATRLIHGLTVNDHIALDLDKRLGKSHTVGSPHGCDEIGVEEDLGLGVFERRLLLDDHVDLGVALLEDLHEGAIDLVCQYERAGDHRDAEQNRDRRQSRPQLARAESSQDETDHGYSSVLIVSRISPADRWPASRTILPSRRKSVRSAIAAALASCVTMITV